MRVRAAVLCGVAAGAKKPLPLPFSTPVRLPYFLSAPHHPISSPHLPRSHTLWPRSIFVNLEIVEKIYTKKGEHMCPADGYVAFRNSELICGRVGKV